MSFFPGLFFASLSMAGADPMDRMNVVETEAVAPIDERTLAEARRLSDKLGRLVARQAWAGAATTYEELLGLGAPLGFQDLWIGAQLARRVGDQQTTYERLLQAARLEESVEVVEWLWTLEQEYGRVVLFVSDEFRPARLEAASLPLDPDKRLAMKRAQGAIIEEGRFRGMLPVGRYQLGHVSFEVESGSREQVVQLRDDVGPYERTPPPPR